LENKIPVVKIKLMATELGEFPIVTIRNHAGEITIIDLTPTKEDKVIARFLAGDDNVPPEVGIVKGNTLPLSGKIESRAQQGTPTVHRVIEMTSKAVA